jgi:hypothetical protein
LPTSIGLRLLPLWLSEPVSYDVDLIGDKEIGSEGQGLLQSEKNGQVRARGKMKGA